MTRTELAERIRVARESCDLTQEDVARSLGVSRPTVVQIEQGNRTVSSLELQKLAFLFGRDMRDFFGEEFRAEDAIVALFRAEAEAADHDGVFQRLRECIALGRELTNLERLLGVARDLAAVAHYPLPTPQRKWDAIQQGERLADEERRRLGLGTTPSPDMVELMETQGVRTAVVELPADVSGLTIIDAKVGLFTVANAAHHVWRRRFSFAHEYAHVLVDRERSGLISRVSRKNDLPEIRANAFAASFLMPREGVRHFVTGLGKGRPSRAYADVFDDSEAVPVEGRSEPHSQDLQLYDVVQIAHHFGVSRVSALYRLQNLKLITGEEFARLKAEDDAGRGRELAALLELPDPDHEAVRNEFRHRFIGLGLEAYRRRHITRGKLRQLGTMVGLSTDAVDQLIERAGLDVVDSEDEGPAALLPDE
jgi:Zn-dependent peptidase ImmA (M78 family)/transcriptional regulator with XRE-family HTH domain